MSAIVSLRRADAGDADTIAALHSESWRSAYGGLVPDDLLVHTAPAERLATWRARFAPDAAAPLDAVLARVDGIPAGFACLLPDAEPQHGVYLDNLHVLPRFHGLGLGKRLMAWCAEGAARRPGAPLFLYVLDGNVQAREFYRRLDGIESAPFDDTFPGSSLTVAVRRVSWPDVGALLQRLARQAAP